MITTKKMIWALLIAAWLYFLLPATATLFYELYHLTGVGAVYWGYSGFKAAGYYFGNWEYKWLACLGAAAIILLLPGRARRATGKRSV